MFLLLCCVRNGMELCVSETQLLWYVNYSDVQQTMLLVFYFVYIAIDVINYVSLIVSICRNCMSKV